MKSLRNWIVYNALASFAFGFSVGRFYELEARRRLEREN